MAIGSVSRAKKAEGARGGIQECLKKEFGGQEKIQFSINIFPLAYFLTIPLINLTQMLMIGIRIFLKLDCKYLGQGWIQGGQG